MYYKVYLIVHVNIVLISTVIPVGSLINKTIYIKNLNSCFVVIFIIQTNKHAYESPNEKKQLPLEKS